MTNTDTSLIAPAEIPLSRTIVERKSVKKVKLKTNPMTTPMGRELPIYLSPMLEERIIGKIGNMHGESTVIIPAKNAKAISNIIYRLLSLGE